MKDIRDWIAAWNDNPKPSTWTKTADEVFDRLASYLQQIGTCRTDRYRGGLALIHSLNGFRLHQTAVGFESQT